MYYVKGRICLQYLWNHKEKYLRSLLGLNVLPDLKLFIYKITNKSLEVRVHEFLVLFELFIQASQAPSAEISQEYAIFLFFEGVHGKLVFGKKNYQILKIHLRRYLYISSLGTIFFLK